MGCDTHPEYRAVALTGHQHAATPRGREKRGRETAPTLLTGWPWGTASSISHSGAERWLSPSVTGGHAPQAAKGAARQKANYSKDPSPAYGEVAQHNASLGTGHGQQTRACDLSLGCTEATDLNVPRGFSDKANGQMP